MMREDDLSYSRRRADEELARALSLNDPAVAAIHRQLAQAYRKRAADLAAHRQPVFASL